MFPPHSERCLIVYVKEQMGHSSIQVTVDIYVHLIPGANASFVDTLDASEAGPANKSATVRNTDATRRLWFRPRILASY